MPEHVNPLDVFAAVKAMRETVGWKLFMERYAVEGDELLTKILDTELSDSGEKYSKRDLLVHQLEALGRIGKVLNEFETEAKIELDRQKHPAPKGS